MDADLAGIRGTLIVCDQVYQDRSGKFIIAGTYSAWRTREDELRIVPFCAYVRLLVERPGAYRCRIAVIDRVAPPNHPPLIEAPFDIQIGEQHLPVYEAALRLPDLRVRSPKPAKDRAPGTAHGLRTLVTLEVGGVDLGGVPLDFVFLG